MFSDGGLVCGDGWVDVVVLRADVGGALNHVRGRLRSACRPLLKEAASKEPVVWTAEEGLENASCPGEVLGRLATTADDLRDLVVDGSQAVTLIPGANLVKSSRL